MLEILRGLVIENDFVCNVALFYTQVWRYFQFKLWDLTHRTWELQKLSNCVAVVLIQHWQVKYWWQGGKISFIWYSFFRASMANWLDFIFQMGKIEVKIYIYFWKLIFYDLRNSIWHICRIAIKLINGSFKF